MSNKNSKHIANVGKHARALHKIAYMYEELELMALEPDSNLPPILDAMGALLCENSGKSGNLIDLASFFDKKETTSDVNHNIDKFPIICNGNVVGNVELTVHTTLMLQKLMEQRFEHTNCEPFTISTTFKSDMETLSIKLLDFTIYLK